MLVLCITFIPFTSISNGSIKQQIRCSSRYNALLAWSAWSFPFPPSHHSVLITSPGKERKSSKIASAWSTSHSLDLLVCQISRQRHVPARTASAPRNKIWCLVMRHMMRMKTYWMILKLLSSRTPFLSYLKGQKNSVTDRKIKVHINSVACRGWFQRTIEQE